MLADESLVQVRLDYQLAPGAEGACPDETAFRKRVALRLGYDPFIRNDTADRMRVRIEQQRSQASARIDLTSSRGHILGSKKLDAVNCDEVVANAAFAASLALDPAAAARSGEQSTTETNTERPQTNAPPPPAVFPDAVATPTPKSEAPIPLRSSDVPTQLTGFLRIGAGAAVGTAPSVAPNLSFSGDLRRGWLSLGLEGRADLPASGMRSGIDIRTSLLAAGTSLCAHTAARFDLYGCIVLYAGALRGETREIAAPARDITPYIATGPRSGLRIEVTRTLGIDLRADLPFVLTETELTVGKATLWTTPTVGILGTAGASVALH